MNDTTTDIVWEDPPPRAYGRGRPPQHLGFFNALRVHPGKWAQWPRQGNTNTAKNTATRINNGRYGGTAAGEFEAVTRLGVVYVRYLDPAAS